MIGALDQPRVVDQRLQPRAPVGSVLRGQADADLRLRRPSGRCPTARDRAGRARPPVRAPSAARRGSGGRCTPCPRPRGRRRRCGTSSRPGSNQISITRQLRPGPVRSASIVRTRVADTDIGSLTSTAYDLRHGQGQEVEGAEAARRRSAACRSRSATAAAAHAQGGHAARRLRRQEAGAGQRQERQEGLQEGPAEGCD